MKVLGETAAGNHATTFAGRTSRIIRYTLFLFERAGIRNPNNTRYQFLQQHNHPIELNTNDKLDQRLNYIQNNPVAAGLVRYPEDNLCSSTGNYAKLPVNLLDVMLI